MKPSTLRRAAAACAVAALAVPAAAAAHPAVYAVTAASAPAGCVGPDASCLTTGATSYAIANDGYALALTESNGLTTGGMLNYRKMPSAWRAGMTAAQKLNHAGAQTGAQAHATCTGSALLDTEANILAWQQRSDNDPFFAYIPWQKTSANLGDEPEKWIGVVKAATGVDLAALTTADQFKAACESAPVSGTYHASDTVASITTALVANAQAPLQAQVGTLQSTVTELQSQVAALTAAKAAAEAANLALVTRPLKLTLAAKRFGAGAGAAMVTGAAGTAVTVKLVVSKADAKQLRLASRTVASLQRRLGAQGAELLSLKLTRTAARAYAKRGRTALRVSVEASGGGTTVKAAGTVTR